MIQVTPVILCGGSGTRLWPLSRTDFPKQFLCLTGNESLFQQAAQRLAALGIDSIQVAAPASVSGEDHRFLASEQLHEVCVALGISLLEPVNHTTTPALNLTALPAVQNSQDLVLNVTPTDQSITKAARFTAAVNQAIAKSGQGNIVILGVTPTNRQRPHPRSRKQVRTRGQSCEVYKLCVRPLGFQNSNAMGGIRIPLHNIFILGFQE